MRVKWRSSSYLFASFWRILMTVCAVLFTYGALFRFPVDDNSTMKSVVEYFQEMYGFTIQHAHLPCLQVGNQRKANYLPMEVRRCHWKFYLSLSSQLFCSFCKHSWEIWTLCFARHAKLLRDSDIRKDWMRDKLLLSWKSHAKDQGIEKMTFCRYPVLYCNLVCISNYPNQYLCKLYSIGFI